MRLIYDIGIRFYSLAARIISPWNEKAAAWVRGRRGWEENLRRTFSGEGRVVWFHCASLGEFEQGRPVMEAMREKCPAYRILLTFFSPSGYEKRKDYPVADHVMYLPLDTARNAAKLTAMVPLAMAIFIKYEFWYHYLRQLNRKGIPVYLASGIFRPGQVFFRWYGRWYRKFLENFTHIFVQHADSGALLGQYGFRNVTIAGDTRFDRVIQVAQTHWTHPELEKFTRDRQVVVAGSTWEADEVILEHAYRELDKEIRWIVAPHELTETHLKNLYRRFPEHVLFTDLEKGIPAGTRMVIVNTIGQLSYLYRFATLAYIGGGFGKGIHNILEAATYSVPVMFGPNHTKFLEARELIQTGGAFQVSDEKALLSTIDQQLHINRLLKTSSETAGKYVIERGGATLAILDFVCKK
jgi:3-deoxy-D-manno-octulosonic-acid transferase